MKYNININLTYVIFIVNVFIVFFNKNKHINRGIMN